MAGATHPLLHYTVDGLLGRGKLKLDMAVGEATILTGANGTGKSTVLRTIDRFARGAWGSLAQLPFESLTFEFQDVNPVRVRRKDDTLEIRQGKDRWTYEPRAGISTIYGRNVYGGGSVVTFGSSSPQPDFIINTPAAYELANTRYPDVGVPARWITTSNPQPEWLEQLTASFGVLPD